MYNMYMWILLFVLLTNWSVTKKGQNKHHTIGAKVEFYVHMNFLITADSVKKKAISYSKKSSEITGTFFQIFSIFFFQVG